MKADIISQTYKPIELLVDLVALVELKWQKQSQLELELKKMKNLA